MNRASLWHITTRAEWEQAQRQGELRPPSLAAEGFMHLSSDEQWPRTAKRFFSGRKGLVLLKLDESRLGSEVRWEEADADRFPHLYGPLPVAAVIEVRPLDVD